jgi:hypothetical protein
MNIPVKVKCNKCGYQWYYTGEKKGSTCSKCRAWIKIKKPANAEPRKKKKMSIEEILNSAVYRSIIFLTDCFDKGMGLRQINYRWALIPNHDNIMEETYNSKKMDLFFKENIIFKNSSSKLDRYFNERIIKKDCITSSSNLSNKLKRLTEEYHILEKVIANKEVEITDDNDNPKKVLSVKKEVSYIITRDGYLQAQRWMANQLVKGIADERLEELNKLIMNFISPDEYHFGISK